MRSYSKPDQPLSTIFYRIREARDKATRRSWQRRARLALAKVPGLTDAERHEIAAVWSRPDSMRYDSPALRKLLGFRCPALPGQTIPAHRAMRCAFDPLATKRAPSPPARAPQNPPTMTSLWLLAVAQTGPAVP